MALKGTRSLGLSMALGLLLIAVLLLSGCDSSVERWLVAGTYAEAADVDLTMIYLPPKEVTIMVDGEEIIARVEASTVLEALEEVGIELCELDRLEPDAGVGVEDRMVIRITRVTVAEDVVYNRIFFQEIRRPNTTLANNVTRVVQQGKEGRRADHYEVIYEDGIEVSRALVRTEVVEPKVDRIVEYGTIGTLSRGGVTYRYVRSFVVTATAYTAGPESTGKSPGHPAYGITFSGLPVQVGHIAVDPTVIPLLSYVYVEGLDAYGAKFDGKYYATDTGSAIKGNRIDIYFENVADALRFGRRQMRVYILARD